MAAGIAPEVPPLDDLAVALCPRMRGALPTSASVASYPYASPMR